MTEPVSRNRLSTRSSTKKDRWKEIDGAAGRSEPADGLSRLQACVLPYEDCSSDSATSMNVAESVANVETSTVKVASTTRYPMIPIADTPRLKLLDQ